MAYKANRGGHAPGHLREAFLEWIDGGRERDTVEIDSEPCPLTWLIGQLWNCTDVLPGADCDALDLPAGSTYAQAVRKVAREV